MSEMTRLENGNIRLRDGYPALSEWIARDSDHEAFVFRRFDRLTARNLLNLQSQLLEIEEKLDELDQESRTQGYMGTRCWELLIDDEFGRDEIKEHNKNLLELYRELERKLEAYQNALLRQAQLTQLKRPRRRPLSAFRHYFHDQGQKDPIPLIGGKGENILDDAQDLVALKSMEHTDVLSRFLQDHWPLRGTRPDLRDSTAYYKERHVVMVVGTISTTIAAALLIGSIAVLQKNLSPKQKIGIVAGFTIAFALSVALLTNAKRAEVFAATAAYMAVLVVFVSGNLGSGSTKS